MDGRSIVYQPRDADSPLLIKPITGGPARQLVVCVKATAFGVGRHGVYYVPCVAAADPPLHVIDPATGRDRQIGILDQFEGGANATPLAFDFARRESILYLRHMDDRADLMLIENFK